MRDRSQHHDQCACQQQNRTDGRFHGEFLVEEQECQCQSDDHAELVNGDHLGHLSDLDGLVIAQPGGAGGQAGQDQEQPAFLTDGGDAALGVGQKHHAPGHEEDNAGSDGGGQVGIDAFNAHLGQNRGQRREHSGQQCQNEPHNKTPLYFMLFL